MAIEFNDNTMLWFGKHKGKILRNVPCDYLEYLLLKGICRGNMKRYCMTRLQDKFPSYQIEMFDKMRYQGAKTVEVTEEWILPDPVKENPVTGMISIWPVKSSGISWKSSTNGKVYYDKSKTPLCCGVFEIK